MQLLVYYYSPDEPPAVDSGPDQSGGRTVPPSPRRPPPRQRRPPRRAPRLWVPEWARGMEESWDRLVRDVRREVSGWDLAGFWPQARGYLWRGTALVVLFVGVVVLVALLRGTIGSHAHALFAQDAGATPTLTRVQEEATAAGPGGIAGDLATVTAAAVPTSTDTPTPATATPAGTPTPFGLQTALVGNLVFANATARKFAGPVKPIAAVGAGLTCSNGPIFGDTWYVSLGPSTQQVVSCVIRASSPASLAPHAFQAGPFTGLGGGQITVDNPAAFTPVSGDVATPPGTTPTP